MDEKKGSKSLRPPKVKNKSAAPVQITAEQILREAHDRRLEPVHSIPQQKIAFRRTIRISTT
ncbi:unnamed protein product [Cunninghamella blakesleeana]